MPNTNSILLQSAISSAARATRLYFEPLGLLRDWITTEPQPASLKRVERADNQRPGFDPTTGFYSRQLFFRLAVRETQRARRYEYPSSILVVNFSNVFEVLQDRGWSAYEYYLSAPSRRVENHLRGGDIPGRFGPYEI